MTKPFIPFLFLLVTHFCGAATSDEQIGEITRRCSRSLVVVESENSSGSGFLAQFGEQKCLFTNQHVVAGAVRTTFTLPNQAFVKVGSAAAAVDHDIIAYGIPADSEVMEIMQGVDQNALIGDEIAVLGNPRGGGVIHPVTGRIVGIGPQLVEISAAIVAGNSGSPVVHLKTGKVIAVASYLQYEKGDMTRGKSGTAVRRFCYRLDSIKKWERVRWADFNDDAETIEKVRTRTNDLCTVVRSAGSLRMLRPESLNDPEMAAILRRYQASLANTKTLREKLSVIETLVKALQAASTLDTENARRRMTYDYFTKLLADELNYREPFPIVMAEARKELAELESDREAISAMESQKRR